MRRQGFRMKVSFIIIVAMTFSWMVVKGQACVSPDSGEDSGGSCTFTENKCDWQTSGNWIRSRDRMIQWIASSTDEVVGTLKSPKLCPTGNHYASLEFKYSVSHPSCSLSVNVTSPDEELWRKNTPNSRALLSPPILFSRQNNVFQIIFKGNKSQTSRWCKITIDNILYKYVPTTTSTTATTAASLVASSSAVGLSSAADHADSPPSEPRPDEQTGADDSGTAIVVGAAVAAVVLAVVAVVFVVLWWRRRGRKASASNLSMLQCLKRKERLLQSKPESLNPGVHNAIYYTNNEQLTVNTVHHSHVGAKPKEECSTYELASAPQSREYCTIPIATVFKPAPGNTSAPESTYFELKAEAAAENRSIPDGHLPYEISDSIVFDEHYSTPADTVPMHRPDRDQGGDNLGYELASLPIPDSCYSSAPNTKVRKNPTTKDQDSSPKHVAKDKSVDHADGYNKLSHQPPRAANADTNSDYSHLNQGKALQPTQLGMAEYSLAKPGEMKTTHPSNKGTGTNYVNVDLPTMPTDDEYNRLNLDGNHRMATAGGDAGGHNNTEYNHLNAEGFQKPQDDEYNSLNFEGPGQSKDKQPGTDVYSHLSSS